MSKLQRAFAISSLVLLAGACGAKEKAPPSSTQAGLPGAEPAPAPSPASKLMGVSDTLKTSMGPLHVAPIWHGTLAFQIGETVIVVDPWSKAPADRLPKADLILITDIHPDHLDPDAIAMVRKESSILIGPQAVADALQEASVQGLSVLKNGESRELLGIGIEATPMYNLVRGPSEGTLFHDKGRGNGYLLSFGDTRVYISGDTECTPEMKALKDIDLAFVCMNLPYTMPPAEAAECVRAFAPKIVIPFHYRGSSMDEFVKGLGDSPVEVRQRDFYRAE